MDELLESDLDFEHSDDAEDSDYSPSSSASDQYAFDALDDAIWNDSASSSALSDDSFGAESDAAAFQAIYAEDGEDDLAASTDDEQSAAEEQAESAVAVDAVAADREEAKQSEMESDSEYNPDGDCFDYFGDYEAEMAPSSSSAVGSESEGATASDSGLSTEDDSLFDYDPDYDLADYSGDFETFDEGESLEADLIENSLSEALSEQSESARQSSQSDDDEDDVAEESGHSDGSGSADNARHEGSV